MTSNQARELREALDRLENEIALHGDDEQVGFQKWLDDQSVICGAARTIALPILEADADLLERIAVALFRWRFGEDPTPDWGLDREHREVYWSQAQVVLAALIPTEENR